MTPSPTSPPAALDSFETELLGLLRAEVSSRSAPATSADSTASPTVIPLAARRMPRALPRRRSLLAAAAAAVATLAVASALSLTASPAAYAVSANGSGDVTVTVTRLEDSAGLEAALAAHGIKAKVDYLPAGKTCAQGRFEQAHPPGGVFQLGTGVTNAQPALSLTVPKAVWDPSWTLVLAHSGDLTASFGSIGVATGAVGPCQLVDQPTFVAPGGPGGPASGPATT